MDALKKAQVKSFLDQMSSALEGTEAEVEVVGADIGDQIDQNWSELVGVSFDLVNDVLSVTTEHHAHRIQHPIDVHFRWRSGGIEQLIVNDPDGHRYFVKFRRPLSLLPPRTATTAA